jgi:hypothetical protein
MNTLLHERFVFPLIFLLCLFTFLAHTFVTKSAIFADGRFYYAITRSIVKDFDIRFDNEYSNLGVGVTHTPTGYTWNKYSPGSSFMWLPLFSILSPFDFETQGYGIVYQTSIAITQAFLSALGLYLVFRLLVDHFPRQISLITSVAIFSATNLIFYAGIEPINSHASSFFISSLFIYYFLKGKKNKHYYLILGVIGGFAGIVRTQDAFILTLPVIQIILKYRDRVLELINNQLALIAGTMIGFLPQLIFWKIIFGSFIYSPYLEEGFNFSNPHIGHVLLNTQNGLFTITPMIAVAVFGLLKNRGNKTLKNIYLYGLLYFILQIYLISSWSSYYQGGSYSIRMIISTYPLLAFGIASVFDKIKVKLGLKAIYTVIMIFSVANVVQIIHYLLKY